MPKDKALAALVGAARVLDDISVETQQVAGGLTRQQLRALSIVGTHEDMRLADLAGNLDVTPSTAVRTVDRLVADKLVRRRANPDDRREVKLRITRHGLEILEQAADVSRSAMAAILDRMADSDITALIDGVRAFLDAAGYEPESLVVVPVDEDDDSDSDSA